MCCTGYTKPGGGEHNFLWLILFCVLLPVGFFLMKILCSRALLTVKIKQQLALEKQKTKLLPTPEFVLLLVALLPFPHPSN